MILHFNKSILEDVRVAVGLSKDTTDFDTELLMHINTAIATLRQNGVTNFIIVEDANQMWIDLIDPTKIKGNEYFGMVPLFVTLSTKIIFDPPPPSTVEQYSKNIDQILWRLRHAYEEPIITKTIVID